MESNKCEENLTMYPLLRQFDSFRVSKNLSVNRDVDVPFPTERLAGVVYEVLRVDAEPKRSGVTKTLTLESNILHAHFTAPLARQLRVAVNGFFENVALITETIEFADA